MLYSGFLFFLLNNLKWVELYNIKSQSVLSIEHIFVHNLAIVNMVVFEEVQFAYADERFPQHSDLIIVGLIYLQFYLFTSGQFGKNASFQLPEDAVVPFIKDNFSEVLDFIVNIYLYKLPDGLLVFINGYLRLRDGDVFYFQS